MLEPVTGIEPALSTLQEWRIDQHMLHRHVRAPSIARDTSQSKSVVVRASVPICMVWIEGLEPSRLSTQTPRV